MKETDILCASDLSAASTNALIHALRIANRLNSKVSLLHVLEKDDASSRDHAQALLEQQISEVGGGNMTILLPKGDPLTEIARECEKGAHGLIVLGTHGLRGLRQKLFGADILKLVRRTHIPSLVVQEETPDQDGSGPIVLPVAAHEDIGRLLDIVIALARAFAAEVHVYQLMRPREQPSDELITNKMLMLQRLKEANVRHKEVNEPGTGPSLGFAGPTIEYAERIGAGCMAIMSHASREYRYIADAEKERLLMNEARIPVLCA